LQLWPEGTYEANGDGSFKQEYGLGDSNAVTKPATVKIKVAVKP
jgi:hypothetical protein